MKKIKKGVKEIFKNDKIIALIISLIFILVISVLIYLPKDCGENKECFIEKAQTCSKAKLISNIEGNLYEYEIKSQKRDDCIFSIKLKRMKENTDYKMVHLLEGKEMLCKVPLEKFKEDPLKDMRDYMDYCSGPLKESLLQLTVERLYSIVVSNIGNINDELQKLVS